MPLSADELAHFNGRAWRGASRARLAAKLEVINAISDPFDRAAYLAWILINDQPFVDGNHRTAARAAYEELQGSTGRSLDEIENWLRNGHERHISGFGMDIQMGQDSDIPMDTTTRTAFIRFLGG